MQKENYLTVDQWCDQWFTSNRHKWNGNTEGGYRNLIYSHIIPSIGSVALSDLTKQTITDFYDSLRSQGLSARSVWCVHLLLRRCMDEAAQDQLIPYNPVRLCQEPKEEEYKTAPLRLGQLQRYLNAAEQLGVWFMWRASVGWNTKGQITANTARTFTKTATKSASWADLKNCAA